MVFHREGWELESHSTAALVPANERGAIRCMDSPSLSLWLGKQEVYRLLLSRSPA